MLPFVDRSEVKLREHSAVTVPHARLSQRDLSVLEKTKAVRVTDTRDGYVLRTNSTTGVLQLDRIRLVLRPKFTIDGKRLIDWLCYAHGQREPVDSLRNWPLGKDGYAGLVPAALLHECRLLLRRGLRRDYVRRSRVDTTLRGRLDVMAQATRRFGAIDRLHTRTFEYEDGGWENLVCGAALARAAQNSTDPRTTQALLDAAGQFPALPRTRDALPLLARGQYTRLNDHYRPAHAWARMVLGDGGVRDLLDPYGFAAKSLLLNLNVLWENVVHRMAADAAVAHGGRRAQPGEGGIHTTREGAAPGATGQGTAMRPFRPDALLAFPPSPDTAGMARYLVVDAKYKAYQDGTVKPSDRHQLLTYIAGYTDPSTPLALIVHPAPDGPTRHLLRIEGPRGVLGRIEVLGLDTRTTPEQAAGPLRAAIARFAANQPPPLP
ncbi:PE-PGRS family protein [Streptomyces sp. AC536]|uniref:McrC family protein n=1 Tax=Streptomyces buecherae TaxID=2763006 RepID=UPI00164E3BC5|nr:PE-PGRS family protein [Streptomyces buecherae]MBC3982715.1 PE-PGRS family protein [Streptomyces buecherae]QNJ41001.1 PE-PGRS family protein [Streptomyces buecherae]